MTLLQLAQPTLIPVRLNGVEYRLGGGYYTLMHGTTPCVALLANHGAGPATVAGCFSGASGTLTVEAGDAFMMGWDVAGTTWRVLRMCGARIVGPEGLPPGVQMHSGPVPTDEEFVVEALDGTAACVTVPVIVEYLAGRLPTLAGLQISPARDGQR